MSQNTQDNVITFLKRSRADRFDITWYGGEPLLAWDIIKSITQRLIQQNIDFSAGMITNAYEFDNKKISELDKLRIKDIQITIDGLKDTHNKKRPHRDGSGTFDRIIENIKKLMDNWQGFINIRVNVDKNNIEEYISLSKYLTSLPFFDKKRIRIHPGIITDFTKDCSNSSSCLLNNSQVAEFMFRAYQKHNINDFDFYPEKMYESCTATSLNDYVIDAFGDLYKCWCNVGDKEKSVGNINDSSKLNFKLISRFLSELEPFDDPKCKDCFFLPLCNGGCPYINYQNRFEGKKINNCCLWKEDIKKFLEFTYEKKLSDKV